MNQKKNEISSRLVWATRRGMLELDVLLGQFLKEAYPSLSPEDQATFQDLLNGTDPEIFAWIMGREVPHDARFVRMVGMISAHAKSKF